ncbi:hypothetical protein M9H61_09155 [Thalassospira sp. GO-4]|jgi:hypothetical protein|uniref:hypothetical protein n=1 Tax=Thalassospira sp. GO-4 TaxID=2946605 RepID=UPI002024C56C|nr:hypothetical protein [Thalassospira sp. GO-4]URK19658.1 hypothetical protein M9H61_09155 [Thalassospira sp. GO-4]
MTLPPQAISPGTAVGGQASAGGTTGQASQGSVPAQVTATVTSATSQQVAAALAKLPVETLLQASVQSQSGNQLTLVTALGQVTVKLPSALPTNLGDLLWARLPTSNAATSSATMGATNPGDGLRLQLLPQTLMPGSSAMSGSLASGNIGATTLTPGQTFNAVTTSVLTMPNGTQLPAGSQTQVIFLGQGTVTAQQAANVLNAASGIAGGVAGGTVAGATPGAGIAPTIAAQTAAGQAPGLLLSGTVLPPDSAEARLLPQGVTALRTSAGIVGIKLPVPAPTGATLSFSVDAAGSGRVATSMPMTEADLILRGQNAALTHDWDSLQKAVHALQQHDPGAAMSLLNNLPQPGPKLTTTMMFFFAAMTGTKGGLRSWIGDRAANSLSSLSEADGGGLKRLEGDFGQLRTMAADERPDGWRVMAMPFNMGGKIEQLQFGWRHGDREDDPEKKDDQGTRFLLDLSFSVVGHTQLDGLVKGEDSKFDLIIRTENPLQSHNRDDIRGIFREALQISGYSGHILFQDGSRFVHIAPPADSSGPNSHSGIQA